MITIKFVKVMQSSYGGNNGEISQLGLEPMHVIEILIFVLGLSLQRAFLSLQMFSLMYCLEETVG
jgi:hypothetical protein